MHPERNLFKYHLWAHGLHIFVRGLNVFFFLGKGLQAGGHFFLFTGKSGPIIEGVISWGEGLKALVYACKMRRCKFISFASCARAYETWKQCQWIIRTLTCKHKIWGENWLCLRPYLKAFPVFNALETCREYFLAIDLGIVEFITKFIERFLEKCEIFRDGPNYVQ